MKKILTRDEEWRKLSKVMIGIWTSLESHLLWVYNEGKLEKNRDFQKKVIREYAEMINLLSELLK